jgi:hypothetical protein
MPYLVEVQKLIFQEIKNSGLIDILLLMHMIRAAFSAANGCLKLASKPAPKTLYLLH